MKSKHYCNEEGYTCETDQEINTLFPSQSASKEHLPETERVNLLILFRHSKAGREKKNLKWLVKKSGYLNASE